MNELNPKDASRMNESAMPELPRGWVWTRLGDISHSIGGYAFKSSDFKENGMYQVIIIGNVKTGYLRLDEKPSFIDNVNSQIMNKYRLDYPIGAEWQS